MFYKGKCGACEHVPITMGEGRDELLKKEGTSYKKKRSVRVKKGGQGVGAILTEGFCQT